MADITLTADEVGLLDAALGSLNTLGLHYVPAVVFVDPDKPEEGGAGQANGTLEAFADAPSGALAKGSKALADLRAGTLKPPVVVPEIISDRQFAQALAQIELISQDEALAWVKVGTLPTALQDAVNEIGDAGQKFAAEMLLSGATSFERHHPMVEVLRDAMKKTDANLDGIWLLGASL